MSNESFENPSLEAGWEWFGRGEIPSNKDADRIRTNGPLNEMCSLICSNAVGKMLTGIDDFRYVCGLNVKYIGDQE